MRIVDWLVPSIAHVYSVPLNFKQLDSFSGDRKSTLIIVLLSVGLALLGVLFIAIIVFVCCLIRLK